MWSLFDFMDKHMVGSTVFSQTLNSSLEMELRFRYGIWEKGHELFSESQAVDDKQMT